MADARDPGLDPGTADAVLLLGPLYHLDRRADRRKALAAAARAVRPGGLVFAAAISRCAARLDGVPRNIKPRPPAAYRHTPRRPGGCGQAQTSQICADLRELSQTRTIAPNGDSCAALPSVH